MKFECYCGHTFESEWKSEYDLSQNPQIITDIKNGDFLSSQCPQCGNSIKPESTVTFHNDSIDLHMLWLPEIRKIQVIEGTYEIPQGINRVTVGYKELVESILVMEESLDPRVIEALKLQILKKIESNEDVQIVLHDTAESELVFYIDGLKQSETAMIRIPKKIYVTIEKDLAKLSENPVYEKIFEGPYYSINMISSMVDSEESDEVKE